MLLRIARRFEEWSLKRSVNAAPGARLQPGCSIVNNQGRREAIEIGTGSVIAGELLVFADRGHIAIGQDVFIGQHSRVWSGLNVTIGSRVMISHGVNIMDSAFHDLSAAHRHAQFQRIFRDKRNAVGDIDCKEVVIEDDVWIGFHAAVMQGVRIGRGAVVAAGAIVTRDVNPFTVVGGAPAKAVGRAME
jgi:acetyltransferase-like isoleucine patch superfamily enzyme